jgi:quercetin dioxygenase-like cupin family protein
MADVIAKRMEELEPYRGPHEIPGVQFVPLAKPLGVTAWGMNVLVLAPNATEYPEHDHQGDGQEEVYTVIEGAAMLRAGGQEIRMAPGVFVRVGPKEKRKIVAGDRGATVLALGATPGKAYVAKEF